MVGWLIARLLFLPAYELTDTFDRQVYWRLFKIITPVTLNKVFIDRVTGHRLIRSAQHESFFLWGGGGFHLDRPI